MIFDENKAETEPQEPKFEIWTAPPTARAKENEQKPEKWSNVKVRVGVELCANITRLTGHLTGSSECQFCVWRQLKENGGCYLIDQH